MLCVRLLAGMLARRTVGDPGPTLCFSGSSLLVRQGHRYLPPRDTDVTLLVTSSLDGQDWPIFISLCRAWCRQCPPIAPGQKPRLGQDLYPGWFCDLGEAPNLCPGSAFLGREAPEGHP